MGTDAGHTTIGVGKVAVAVKFGRSGRLMATFAIRATIIRLAKIVSRRSIPLGRMPTGPKQGVQASIANAVEPGADASGEQDGGQTGRYGSLNAEPAFGQTGNLHLSRQCRYSPDGMAGRGGAFVDAAARRKCCDH